VTNEALSTFGAKVAAATDAGTIDSPDDTTLNWMPAIVDEQGWTKIAEILDQARHRILEVAAASHGRLKDGKEGIAVVTGLAAFEAAPAVGAARDPAPVPAPVLRRTHPRA
jgi:hypothetical protein